MGPSRNSGGWGGRSLEIFPFSLWVILPNVVALRQTESAYRRSGHSAGHLVEVGQCIQYINQIACSKFATRRNYIPWSGRVSSLRDTFCWFCASPASRDQTSPCRASLFDRSRRCWRCSASTFSKHSDSTQPCVNVLGKRLSACSHSRHAVMKQFHTYVVSVTEIAELF